MLSRAALTTWAFVAFRLNPTIQARASLSQYGAPRPTKAGTRNTPLLSGTDEASFSVSDAFSISCNSFFNQLMVSPVQWIFPSNTKSISLLHPNPMDVTNPLGGDKG